MCKCHDFLLVYFTYDEGPNIFNFLGWHTYAPTLTQNLPYLAMLAVFPSIILTPPQMANLALIRNSTATEHGKTPTLAYCTVNLCSFTTFDKFITSPGSTLPFYLAGTQSFLIRYSRYSSFNLLSGQVC